MVHGGLCIEDNALMLATILATWIIPKTLFGMVMGVCALGGLDTVIDCIYNL